MCSATVGCKITDDAFVVGCEVAWVHTVGSDEGSGERILQFSSLLLGLLLVLLLFRVDIRLDGGVVIDVNLMLRRLVRVCLRRVSLNRRSVIRLLMMVLLIILLNRLCSLLMIVIIVLVVMVMVFKLIRIHRMC